MTNQNTDNKIEEATKNSEPISQAGRNLVTAAINSVAADTGRTPKEQQKRIGDKFAYESVDDDPHQRQLDDYQEKDGVIIEEMPVSSNELGRRTHSAE